MTHERPAHTRRSVADRATTAQQVLRIGSWKVPVTVVAWSVSVILHGGLLTASYFATWSPATVSNPEVSFARGYQATQIQILLEPWPDPHEEEKKKLETREEISPPESSAVTVSAEKVEVVPVPEDATSDGSLDPPVTASGDRDLLAEKEPEATDVAEVRAFEHVQEDPPADDAVEANTRTQPVEENPDYPLERLERFVTPPKTSEQVVRQEPRAPDAVEDAAAPPTEKADQSNASSSQTTGVETGIEMLDLPTPRYPLLSRRRGEEGLVLLQVDVLPDGAVGDITVLQDAGFRRLAEAAIAAVRKGRFKPAMRDGHPIRATVRIPFRFVLR